MSYPYGLQAYPPRKPSGAAAIAAAVITLLQALLCAVILVAGFFGSASDHRQGLDMSSDYAALAAFSAATLLLLTAGLLLLFRFTAGRVMVIGLSALVALGTAVGVAVSVVANGISHDAVVPLGIVLTIVFVIEVPTLCLALASSTGRWIAARPR
jgi:hypothetical protein